MWAPVRVVPAGKPVTVTVKSALAAVMLPAASLVLCIVTVTVPLADASALVVGVGNSLPGSSVAVNFGSAGGVGAAGVSLPQLTAAASTSPSAKIEKPDFMCESSRV